MASAIFPVGEYEYKVLEPSVASHSHITVTFEEDTGDQVGAGLIRYIELHPGVGFTIHLTTPVRHNVHFTWKIEASAFIPTLDDVVFSGDTTGRIMSYATHPTFTESTQIIDKEYVDDHLELRWDRSGTELLQHFMGDSVGIYDSSATPVRVFSVDGLTGNTYIKGNLDILGTITNSLFYGSHPTFTADTQLVDKKYVDDKVVLWSRIADEHTLTPYHEGDSLKLYDSPYAPVLVFSVSGDEGNVYIKGNAHIKGNITTDIVASYLAHPSFTSDTQIVDKKYVDDAVFTENLWDRSGVILKQHYAGDSVELYDNSVIPVKVFSANGLTGNTYIKGNLTTDNIASYTSHPTFTTNTQIPDKKYVDDADLIAGVWQRVSQVLKQRYAGDSVELYDNSPTPIKVFNVAGLTGNTYVKGNITSDSIASYTSHPTFTTNTQIPDKKYVDDADLAAGVWQRVGTVLKQKYAGDNVELYDASLVPIKVFSTSGSTGNTYVKGNITTDNIASYTAHPTFNDDKQIVDKKYVDDAVLVENLWDRADLGGGVFGIYQHTIADKVGIGTATPSANLHIVNSSLGAIGLLLDGAGAYSKTFQIKNYYSNATHTFQSTSDGANLFAFDTGANERFFINKTSTGDVYIATGGGQARFGSTAASYSSHPTFSTTTQIVDKKYVDDGLATKEPVLTHGNLTSSDITVGNGSNAVIGTGTTLTVNKGNLTSSDITVGSGSNVVLGSGTTLTINKGSLTEATSSVLTITGANTLLSGTTIEVKLAGIAQSGYLSSSNWNTFNNKQNALTFGNLSASSPLSQSGGTGAVIGSGVTISIQQSDSTHNGYLSSGDWSTFYNKQNALTFGDLTGTNIGITGGTGAVIGGGVAISIPQSVATSATPTFAQITISNTPTNNSDAARKDYVDSKIQGMDWQASVKAQQNDPPGGTPTLGDRYLIYTAPTGVWVGHANQIAQWNGAGWTYTVPNEGFSLWVEGSDVALLYNGTAWVQFGSTITHNNLSGLQGGLIPGTTEYYHLNAADWGNLTSAYAQLSALLTTGAPSFNGLALTNNVSTTMLVGTNASAVDFPNAQVIISKANSGLTDSGYAGLIVENIGDSSNYCSAIDGFVKTNGTNTVWAIQGRAYVTASADTAMAMGGLFRASETHSGGENVGAQVYASGSSVANTALDIIHGHIRIQDTTTAIVDTSNNEILKFAKVTSSVNELSISNAITLNPPSISATGTDGNISISLIPKGTGVVQVQNLSASKPVFTDANKGLVSTGTLAYDQGGTGQTTWTKGDLLYSDANNSLAKRGIGTAGYFLQVIAGVPDWFNLFGTGNSWSATQTFTVSSGSAVVINSGTLADITAFGIRDTSATYDLTLAATSSTALTAGRKLTFDVVNADRTLKVSGTSAINQDVTTTGNPTFVNLTITSFANNWTNAGRIIADLGTVTTAVINGGTIGGLTSLAIRDTSAAYDLTLAATSSTALTVGRKLTFDVVNADRTLKISGASAINQDVTTTGNPTFGNLTITSFAANWTNAGRTVADLGTITTVAINGGSINNTTIGASTANTIKGTTIQATTSMALPNGAVGAPALFFTSASTTGLWLDSADIAFSIAGVKRGEWDATYGLRIQGTTGINSGIMFDIDGSGINDVNANELLTFTKTASAVNQLTITNAISGSGPILSATGGDTDITLNLAGKGANGVYISGACDSATIAPLVLQNSIAYGGDYLQHLLITKNSAGTVVAYIRADGMIKANSIYCPTYCDAGGNIVVDAANGILKRITQIQDTNYNELIKFTATTSAVNEITIANNIANNGPSISATGDSTNIDLTLATKGSGQLNLNANVIQNTSNGVGQGYRGYKFGDANGTAVLDFYRYDVNVSYINHGINFSENEDIPHNISEFRFGPWSTSAGRLTSSDGQQNYLSIEPRVLQTGTASYTALNISSTESSVGSGSSYLINAGVGGASKFSVSNGGVTSIGAGTPLSATTTGSLYVQDKLEVTGSLYPCGAIYARSIDYTAYNYYIQPQGGAHGNSLNLLLGGGANQSNRAFVIGDIATGYNVSFAHGVQTNPTLFVHSYTAPTSDATQWISLTHDQTNGVVAVGKGIINLSNDTTINTYQTVVKRISTGNASATNLTTIAVGEGELWSVEADIIGNQSDGSNRAMYHIQGLFYRNTGGNVTQQGLTTVIKENETDAVWNGDFNANTGTQNIEVQVTGKLSTTINWAAVIKYYKV